MRVETRRAWISDSVLFLTERACAGLEGHLAHLSHCMPGSDCDSLKCVERWVALSVEGWCLIDPIS